MISNIYGQIFAIRYYYFVYTTWKIAVFSNTTLHCTALSFEAFKLHVSAEIREYFGVIWSSYIQ